VDMAYLNEKKASPKRGGIENPISQVEGWGFCLREPANSMTGRVRVLMKERKK
jgi:hypothetical protein